MSQAYLIGVLVRLFAIYLFVQTLRVATAMLSANLEFNRWGIAGLVIPLLAALFLWFFNLSLAKRLFYGGSHERALDLSAVVQLEQALFSVVGLWLVCSSLSDCGYWLVLVNSQNSPEWGSYSFAPEQKASMVSSCVQTVLGIFLMFRANGLVRFIARLRG